MENDRPIIGYYGKLDENFDKNLMDSIANNFSFANIYIISEDILIEQNRIPKRTRDKNEIVFFFNKINNEEKLLELLEEIDIFILPFKTNYEITEEQINKIKIFNKPIISTKIKNYRNFNEIKFCLSQKEISEELIKYCFDEDSIKNKTKKIKKEIINKNYENINVIFPPCCTWDGKKQRPHHIARELGTLGYKVYFTDTIFQKEKMEDFFEISKNVFYCKNMRVCEEKLKEDKNSLNILFGTHPAHILEKRYEFNIKMDLKIFDYLDDFDERKKDDKRAIKEADVVFCSGKKLYDMALKIRKDNCRFIENAGDYDLFRTAKEKIYCEEMEKFKNKPIIGYIGALAFWMDKKLLHYIFNEFKEYNFIFIGNNYDGRFDLTEFDKYDNFYYLGQKKYEDLPKYLSYFDICIIPFNDKLEVIKATNPLKIYEYFSAEKNTVATNMDEIKKYSPAVLISNSEKSFADNIRKSFKQIKNKELKKLMVKYAKENDWIERTNKISTIILEFFRNKYNCFHKTMNIKLNKKTKFFFPSRRYLIRNFVDCFKEEENIDCLQAFDLGNRENFNEFSINFENYIKEYRPDFLFWEGLCLPKINRLKLNDYILELKKKYNFKIIYWATEDPPHHEKLSKVRAEISDFVFCTDVEFKEEYEKMGKPSEHLMFACNPNIHKIRTPEKQYECDIIFIGNNYDHQERLDGTKKMILPLINKKYNFRIYGIWWAGENPYIKNTYKIDYPIWRGALANRELSYAYSSSKISLGLVTSYESRTHVPYRPFEAMVCGSLHISQHCIALENIFMDNIILVKNEKEFLDKIDYYLKNEEERKLMIDKCRDFVLQNHTYYHRSKQILSDLKNYDFI